MLKPQVYRWPFVASLTTWLAHRERRAEYSVLLSSGTHAYIMLQSTGESQVLGKVMATG